MNSDRLNQTALSGAESQTDERDRADMQRLASGHEASLNDLMQRHAPKLFLYLIRCLQNEEEAADAAQETFVRVYQNRARFDPKRRFSTWLYAIATNLVKDRYRYRRRHPQVSLDAENENLRDFHEALPENRATPSESLLAAEAAAAVRKALARLPEDLRTPLILAEYDDLSHAEIATILDCSAKAVESRIYRARQQLRAQLSRYLD